MIAVERLVAEFARERRPLRLLGASGQLGYGIPTAALQSGMLRKPDMIGCDMGSIDIGPYYLGSGMMATSPEATRRDLRKVLLAARSADIPLIIGSAGSAGARPHLDATISMIRDIAAVENLTFKLATISSDLSRERLQSAIVNGKVSSLDDMPDLCGEDVDMATNLVSQVGSEAFQRALSSGADVIIAGRACDTGIFASLPILLGFDAGLATHMAKIIECASLCCVPGGRDAILATLDDDGFVLESMNPARAATPASVAAHSLYEQSDPLRIYEPAGYADLGHVKYDAVDERRTRVSGAVFVPAETTRVKLEGARLAGYRSIVLAATADPRFIEARRDIFEGVEAIVETLVCEDTPRDFELSFRLYGLDAVQDWRPAPPVPAEAMVMIECIAPTAARAAEVARTAKQYMLHHGYPGRLSTAGNLAFPFTPPEVDVGPAYTFNVYHLLEVDDDMADFFPVTIEQI